MHNSQTTIAPPKQAIKAEPIKMQWEPGLPVFAKEEFLRAVGDEYGWLGGFDGAETPRCLLPYTVVRAGIVRLVRFRTAPIPCGTPLDPAEEQSFLNCVVRHFRETGADLIIPASNNAIFRSYPEGATAAPYGTYIVDLQQPEEVLWKNIGRKTRQNIGTAERSGIVVRESRDFDKAYDLIRETFRRSKLPFMNRAAFARFADGLGEQGMLLAAGREDETHSYVLFGFSRYCAYAIYAGNLEHQHQGANKLLYWEAMRRFRDLGARTFDFYGARVNPEKGSKQEGINQLKILMGASLSQGYMWKYSLRPWRAWMYTAAVRMLRGGDIVDQEAYKLGRTPAQELISENEAEASV
jgi:hypothetical protein